MAYCKKFLLLLLVFLIVFSTFYTVSAYDNSFTEFDLTDYYQNQLSQFRERFYMLCVMGKFDDDDKSKLYDCISHNYVYIYYVAPNSLCFYSLQNFNAGSDSVATVNDYYQNVAGKNGVAINGILQLTYTGNSSFMTMQYSLSQLTTKFITFSFKQYHYLSVLDKGLVYLYQKEHPDVDYQTALNDIRSKLQDIINYQANIEGNTRNTLEATRENGNFLKDETVADSSISMDGVDNSSTPNNDSMINNYFTDFANIFTNDSKPHTISIPVPFTGKSFNIDDRATYYFLSGGSDNIQNSAGAIIYLLIQSWWYFLLGFFVFKDIQKLIDKFSSGQFGGTDTNIKADML